MTAVRVVGAGSRDERDAAGLMPGELDLSIGRCAGGDARTCEEFDRGEIVNAARAVDEVQRYRLSSAQVDRLRVEAEALDVDRHLGRLRGDRNRGEQGRGGNDTERGHGESPCRVSAIARTGGSVRL